MSRSLRDQMPQVAAFIDDLREAFGREVIDGQIRAGLAGQPVFHAREGGHEIGTPVPKGKREFTYEGPSAPPEVLAKGARRGG